MYEIIASIDDEESRAIEQAEAIADLPLDPSDVRVRIVHCFSDNPSGASIHQVKAVRTAEEKLEAAGLTVTLEEVSNDDPAERILEAADDHDADMIVVAGRKRSPAAKALFGSVSQNLLLNTDRPVLVCGEIES